jgi:ribose 1,5-bisphosphate isomerase
MQPAIYHSVEHILEEVRTMRVKGGSAFGVAAAQAFRFVAQDQEIASTEQLFSELDRVAVLLLAEKPTMGTVHNAYQLIVTGPRSRIADDDVAVARNEIADRADRFVDHSVNAVIELGRVGSELVRSKQTIMMHSYSASVLSVFETARQAGKQFQVICTESRPLRESRMAASRLSSLGVPVTFVTDASMAAFAVKADWILVGADSLAVDGSVANKMGTNLLSIVADRLDVPFYVASEVLKLQPRTREGSPIVLEKRPISEMVRPDDFEHAENVTIVNQFFDLTPPQRIRAIITEQGVYSPGQIAQAWLKLQKMFEGMRDG